MAKDISLNLLSCSDFKNKKANIEDSLYAIWGLDSSTLSSGSVVDIQVGPTLYSRQQDLAAEFMLLVPN